MYYILICRKLFIQVITYHSALVGGVFKKSHYFPTPAMSQQKELKQIDHFGCNRHKKLLD